MSEVNEKKETECSTKFEEDVQDIIFEMIACSEASPYSPSQQLRDHDESTSSIEDIDELSPQGRQRNKQTKYCIKLRNILQNQHEFISINNVEDTEEEALVDIKSPHQRKKDNFVIRTSLNDYNSQFDFTSQKHQRQFESHINTNRAHFLSHIPSSSLSKLPPMLAPLITHRIDSSLLLPATQDERANAEVMSTTAKPAKTISQQAMVAAQLYLELIFAHGGNGIGLIDVGVLSAIAALVRRWGIELRGREPKVVVAETKRNIRANKGAKMTSSRNIRNKTRNDYDSESDSDEGMNNLTIIDDNRDENVSEKDFLSDTQLIHEGLQLALALSYPLLLPQFPQWSTDAKEAMIDAAVSALAYTCSIFSGLKSKTFRTKAKEANFSNLIFKMCQKTICCLSQGLEQCIKASLDVEENCSQKTSKWKKKQINQSHESIVFILRVVYPFLCLKVEVPNGHLGKIASHDKFVCILGNITKLISTETTKQEELGSSSIVRSGKKTPIQSRSAPLKDATNLHTTTPNVKKIVQLPPSSAQLNSVQSKQLSCPLSEPRLKCHTPRPCHTKSPFRALVSSERKAPSKNNPVQPHPLLSPLLGLLQKLSTSQNLEKAQPRVRITNILKSILPNMLELERIHFFKFQVAMCHSKISSHRLFASEFIGEIWMQDFVPSNQNLHKDLNVDGLKENHSDIRFEMLKALVERMSDKIPAVRARAVHSLSESLKELQSLHHFDLEQMVSSISTASYRTERSCIDSVMLIVEGLILSLRRLAFFDEKANVRRTAVIALMNFFLFNLCVIEKHESAKCLLTNSDIEAFSATCSDESIATRNAAAEALTMLLQSSCIREYAPSQAAIVELSWGQSVLPLVLDIDTSCVTKATEMFINVVIDPIVQVGKNGAHDLGLIQRYNTAWRILHFAGNKIKGAGATKQLKVVLSKVLEDPKILEKAVMKPLLKEIVRKATITLGIDTDFGDIEPALSMNSSVIIDKDASWLRDSNLDKQRSGAWSLLHAFSGCSLSLSDKRGRKASKFSLASTMKTCSISASFLSVSYERLHKMSCFKEIQPNMQQSIYSTIQACLGTIINLANQIPHQHASQLFELLKYQLVSFLIPVHIIDATIRALVSLTESICVHESKDALVDVKEVCTKWIKKLYGNCEEAIESFISSSKTNPHLTTEYDVTESDETIEIFKRTERAIFLSGEGSLVGFHPDEDEASINRTFSPSKSCLYDSEKVIGLCVRPSNKLKQLIQAMLPSTLPLIDGSQDARKNLPTIRAQAYIALGKFCLRDEALAKESLNMFSREIQQEDEESGENASVKSNALIVLGDLCIRYTNLVDVHLPVIAACMQSKSKFTNIFENSKRDKVLSNFAIVRKHAVLMISSLLLQDYIKWRGLLMFRFLAAAVDEDIGVANIAEMTLCGPLLSKYPNLFLNNFVESLFILNECKAHPIYATVASNGESENGINVGFEGINLSGEGGTEKRFKIYNLMLSHLSDEAKICVTAKLVKEVLAGALETRGDLNMACNQFPRSTPMQSSLRKRYERATNVIIDTFAVLTSPYARVGRPSKNADEKETDTSMDMNTSTSEQIAVAKGKLLSKISRKHLIETVVPILCSLKIVLERNRSPLLSHLMRYLVDIFRSFKEEVRDCLAGDPTLLLELEYDTKQFEKSRREEKRNDQKHETNIKVSNQ